MTKKVFISFASKDAKVAQAVCDALESRGHPCWMASRDVLPGENYQGAIVRAIRTCGMMVMVFSANANNSDEIKKELALASQAKVMVVPVRAEDVIPGEDFTYELATRQWIDLFGDWEQAMDRIGRQVETVIPRSQVPWPVCHVETGDEGAIDPITAGLGPLPASPAVAPPVRPAAAPTRAEKNRMPLMIGGGIAVLVTAVAAGWVLRPAPPAAIHAAAPVAAAPGATAPGATDKHDMELALWDAVKDTGDETALNSYLGKYPGGLFADAARARLSALRKAKEAPVRTAAPTPLPVAKPAKVATAQPMPAMTMPMPAAKPAGTSVPGKLDSNVQMAVDMARAAEKRARDVAVDAQQAAKMAEAGAPGYNVTSGNGPHWEGRVGIGGRNGVGIVTYANGDRYAGETLMGRRNGVGVQTGAPERIYRERVGEFADQMNGYGVVYRRDGRVRIGHWKDAGLDGYGAVYDAAGKLLEQGLYAADTLKTPAAGN
jgi:hypothetical protein